MRGIVRISPYVIKMLSPHPALITVYLKVLLSPPPSTRGRRC